MNESKALVPRVVDVPMITALPVEAIRSRIEKIEEIKKEVMVEGIHYGIIPGTQKPSLWQSGGELLLMGFELYVGRVTVVDLSIPDEARYRYFIEVVTADGTVVGVGVGEASSNEEKFKWRKKRCPAEWEATPRDRRRIKFEKDGAEIQQVRTDPADEAHKVGQFAYKRGLVRAARTVTAASYIFTQDIEDADFNGRPTTRPGRQRPNTDKPTATHEGAIKNVLDKQVSGGNTLWTIIMDDDEKFGTFSDTIGQEARSLADTGQVVEIGYITDSYGKKARTLNLLEAPPVADDPGQGEMFPPGEREPGQEG